MGRRFLSGSRGRRTFEDSDVFGKNYSGERWEILGIRL